MRRTVAKAITEALKQNGIYEIFFVFTLSSLEFRESAIRRLVNNLACIIMHILNILANKLSKQQHIDFETITKEIINLVKKLHPQDELQ